MKYTTFFGYLFIYQQILDEVKADDKENCNDHKVNSLRLKCQLLKEYDPSERPVKSSMDPLSVHIDMEPTEMELSDHDDQLSLTTWMIMNWTDVFLKWNPDDYNGINDLEIECTNIWSPDLIALSALAEDPYQSASNMVCKLNSTGSVSTVFTTTYRTYCTTDRTYWPYDEHTCKLNLGSRVFIGSPLRFILQEITPENLKKDKIWNVKDLKPNTEDYSIGSNDTYTRLEFTFILERHSSIYSATFVYPGVGMAATILAVLWLDVMSPERIYMLALIIFDGITFLEFMTYLFPASGSKPPLLVNFFRDSIIMCGICIVVTIINRQLINSSLKPAWLTAVIRWLNDNNNVAKYFLINMENEDSEIKEHEDESPATFSLASQKRKEWNIFVTLIDRLMFIVYLIIYLMIFIKFYPAI